MSEQTESKLKIEWWSLKHVKVITNVSRQVHSAPSTENFPVLNEILKPAVQLSENVNNKFLTLSILKN